METKKYEARLELKRLRNKTTPHLSMEKMAELLGLPAKSSYQHYEDRQKGEYLPADIGLKIAPILIAHGVSKEEAEALYIPKAHQQAPRYTTAIHFLVENNITDLLPKDYKYIDTLPEIIKNNLPLFITGGADKMEDAAIKPRIELPEQITGDNIYDLIITDFSAYPALSPGDEVFYCADDKMSAEKAGFYAGKLCVVQLVGNAAGLYRLHGGGKPGTFILQPIAGPILQDVTIEWAAPTLMVRMTGNR